ncbi:MAG TPA: hypothetical protein VMT52_01360 [Planctomycetota bacterium]|nr:hypothetical protein [Planctomycetota bacterium]
MKFKKSSLHPGSAPRIPLEVIMISLYLPAVGAGCAPYSAKPLDLGEDAASVVEQREAEGLFVAVKDISGERESVQYLGRDLVKYGFIPIVILLELDRNSDGVFDVRSEDVKLCLRSGHRLQSLDPDRVVEAVSTDRDLAMDYGRKALKSLRVNPNKRSFRRVLFFAVPKDLTGKFTMEDAFMEMKIYKQGQDGVAGKPLEFPIHFGR